MSKKECQLNHSRNMSNTWRSDSYFYNIERSKATAKQVKFYQKLRYMFTDNGININEELDKRNIRHQIIQNPSGRAEFSEAIGIMIKILTEKGIYHQKNDRSDNFVPTYNCVVDSGGAVVESYQKINYVDKPEEGVVNEYSN